MARFTPPGPHDNMFANIMDPLGIFYSEGSKVDPNMATIDPSRLPSTFRFSQRGMQRVTLSDLRDLRMRSESAAAKNQEIKDLQTQQRAAITGIEEEIQTDILAPADAGQSTAEAELFSESSPMFGGSRNRDSYTYQYGPRRGETVTKADFDAMTPEERVAVLEHHQYDQYVMDTVESSALEDFGGGSEAHAIFDIMNQSSGQYDSDMEESNKDIYDYYDDEYTELITSEEAVRLFAELNPIELSVAQGTLEPGDPGAEIPNAVDIDRFELEALQQAGYDTTHFTENDDGTWTIPEALDFLDLMELENL